MLMSILLVNPKVDKAQKTRICEQETRIEMGIPEDSNISKEDLLGSIHDLSFLSSLYRSIVSTVIYFLVTLFHISLQTWFVEQLRNLRSSPEDDLKSPTSATSTVLPILPSLSDNRQLQLPLSRDMGEYVNCLQFHFIYFNILLFGSHQSFRCFDFNLRATCASDTLYCSY